MPKRIHAHNKAVQTQTILAAQAFHDHKIGVIFIEGSSGNQSQCTCSNVEIPSADNSSVTTGLVSSPRERQSTM